MSKCALIFIGLLLLKLPLSGQCPGRAFLWNRIVYLRDSSQASYANQLDELKTYLGKIESCPNKNDSAIALLLARIGWLYSTQKDFKSAISFTNRALDMIHNHIGEVSINESHLIKYYNNLRILYDSTGQESLKRKAIDSCISLVTRLKFGYKYAFDLVNTKIIQFFERGDYYNCIKYSTFGEFIAEKAGYLQEDAQYYDSWKINSLINLNKFPEASELLEKSIHECLNSGNKKYMGSLLGLKAIIAEEQGHAKEAIYYTRQSIIQNKLIQNYPACAEILIILGNKLYFLKLQQYDEALKIYREALKYATDDISVEILNYMSAVFIATGEFERAFDYIQQAFDKIYPGANESNLLTKSGDEILSRVSAEYVITLILNKAEAYLKKYKLNNNMADLKTATLIYKSADQLMDKIKIVQTEYASKLFWRTDMRRLYEKAIESCLLAGNMKDAFYFFEKSRAVLLNDQIKERGTGDPNIEEMALVKRKILDLERQSGSPDFSTTASSDVQRELFIEKEQLSRLDQLIKTKNPWYYQSLIDTSFISLNEVQKKLLETGGPQAILEFFHGDSSIYILSIGKEKSTINRINKDKYENLVDQYISYLSNPAKENKDYAGFIQCSHDLYQLIFSQLSLPDGKIIISPDGKYYPLEALVTNTNKSTPEYFLKDHIVSYTYSVRYLLNDFSKSSTKSTGNFLGIAPITYPRDFQLASLPNSDASLKKISSYFTYSHSLIGPEASRNHFMQLFQDYKIIQLYTHASDTSNYGEPVIYFSDSALYLSELIPENKIASQLIVLSACETGNGKLFKGEGVFSFNRGFASVGIPSSVINLWSVDDESTYKLTELFYKYIHNGLPLELALQKAKLEFISTSSKLKSLPYYWAAAVLVGKSDKIEMHHAIAWQYDILALGLLILLYLIWRLIRNRFENIRINQ